MSKFIFVLGLFAAFMFTAAGVSDVADEGLVGYWPFDEGAGKVAEDVSGNKLNGAFVGDPKWVEGKFGTALEFDGVDDRVVVADDPKLDLTKNLTLMAWFRPTVKLTSHRMMVKNNSIFVIFDFGNADTVELLVKPNNDFVESTTTDWKIGEWYHFAGTYDGEALRVFINGKLEGEKDYGLDIAPSDLELWIGGDDNGRPTDHFPGIIDEVRIYEKALTEAEVSIVMEAPQTVEAAGKLATSWGQIKRSVF